MSKRATFRANLKRFGHTAQVFGEERLLERFRPELTVQETCVVDQFAASDSILLRFLEVAIAEVGEMDGFRRKILGFQELSTRSGYPQFKSEILEVWLAAQFCQGSLTVTPEPATVGLRKAEFAVTTDDTPVYFEVRNLERPSEMKAGSAGQPWPRELCNSFSQIVRNAYYDLAYPYSVELRRCRLGSSPDDASFEADVWPLMSELRDLLRRIGAGEVSFEDLPAESRRLPRHSPVAEIVGIVPGPGSHTWVHFGGEWTSCGQDYSEDDVLTRNAYSK